MPATAGRVRMPANNRVHSSAALQTHGIWQVAIGYDPYAPANKDKESKPDSAAVENAYDSFQGLLSLARITNTNSNETRGACKKCGRVGHLTYQCRNFLSFKDGKPLENDDSALHTASAVFEKIKKAAGGGKEKEESESDDEDGEEEISSSDSDVDPEIERIIAERFGKPLSKKVATLSKGSKKSSNSSGDDDKEEERRKKRKHGHKKKRRSHGHSSHHRRSDSSDDELDSDRHRKHKRWRRRRSESRDADSGSGFERHGKRLRHKERRSVLSSDSESTASDEDERMKRREKRRSKGHKRGEKDGLD